MTTFRTRARTVDMLGRQQIAGIPTAISELFKNAHDAYATEAIVDYYRSDGLFVLRDNGLGMTEKDFEERWLTLGTDSKVAANGSIDSPLERTGHEKRAILGEKGIGRLAIASIGPQTLLLSRPERGGELGDLLVAFINWGMFEFPSVNLEEIEIPTVTLQGGTIPDRADLRTLIDWTQENLDRIGTSKDQILRKRISNELQLFRSIDPAQIATQLGPPDLAECSGTHFIIQPASDLITDELSLRSSSSRSPAASNLRKTLVGFANTMIPDSPKPPMRTSFRDHYTEDAFEDVIGEGEFFTSDEFRLADHHIQGTFDEFGQFKGSVGIYGGADEEYVVSWSEALGRKTACGPFRFDLAYVQGAHRDSSLAPDDFARISSKLSRYGGLYIYRDGIRVLPYGNSDFDFLEIEVQRAKSASDAFFSHRRMFGVVGLTRDKNESLSEKAGREGFSDNTAYRQLRSILRNFLRQTATDYFRDTGPRSGHFRDQQAELNRLEKARAGRKKQVRGKRKKLVDELDAFFARVDAGEHEVGVERLLAQLDGMLTAAARQQGAAKAASDLMAAERSSRGRLYELEEASTLRRPRGIGLTKAQSTLWAAYENEKARLADELFVKTDREISKRVGRAFASADMDAERRIRFDSGIEQSASRGSSQVASARRELRRASKDILEGADHLATDVQRRWDTLHQEVLSRAARFDVSEISDTRFLNARDKYELELEEPAASYAAAMSSFTIQLDSLASSQGELGVASTYLDQVEAMETDLEALRDQTERDMELAQLGAAVAVINHEFDNTITSMRRSLQRFKSWSDENPALREPYRDLRSSFEHLDGYLKMFTPLNRRLYRTKVEMAGAEIEKYLLDIFGRRLSSASVSLTATDEFAAIRIEQYPSVIYPVFVNLVDNAIHWLTDYRGERIITLDAYGSSLTVRDTGPGVPKRDRDAIFEFGFSRKSGGSGYGLFIARKALEAEGWTLELAKTHADVGCEFVIGSGTN